MVNFTDVETTSLDTFRGDIISYSAILTDDDLNIVDKINTNGRVEDNSDWSDEAEVVHGISYNEARSFQPQMDMLNQISEFYTRYTKFPIKWVDHARLMFGHASFDFNHTFFSYDRYLDIFKFRKFAIRSNYESTVHLAINRGIKNRKLNDLCNQFGIKLEHHNAESDVMACYELYKIFKTKEELDVFI